MLFAILLTCFAFLVSGQQCSAQETLQDPAWKYVLRRPPQRWFQPDFDDQNWLDGAGGFGDADTPGARVGTDWSTNNIWLRRTIVLENIPENPSLYIHHDEDAEVYINGRKVLAVKGYTTKYQVMPLDEDGKTALKTGRNLIAVHCAQTGGGQFIDVHVIDGKNVPALPAPKRKERPFQSDLITKWGEAVTADNVWQQYPRPGLVRQNWTNLNGNWDYAVTDRTVDTIPNAWDGKILVPFCLESRLGGVQKLLHSDQALWYHRNFDAKRDPQKRLMLNFEAVDYECRIFVNGTETGHHKGGNTPFSVDATDVIVDGKNELVVRVTDDTEESQLRGKQSRTPRGIWYTQVSGIWQTVWMETVPVRHIADLKISTNVDTGSISVTPVTTGPAVDGETIRLSVVSGDQMLQGSSQGTVKVVVPDAKLWSPSSPHLYDLKLAILDASGNIVDEISSYAGIRSVGKAKDTDGHWRMTLNGKPVFHWGPLDRGWWPAMACWRHHRSAMVWRYRLSERRRASTRSMLTSRSNHACITTTAIRLACWFGRIR
ncbi:MAG: hypothetical protein R3C20_20460 [Planctomycetaceae bacterium]